MKRLFLLRHAKTQAGLADHERALTPHGEQDAAAVGRFMAQKGYRPEVIFCSSALRTRQTVQHLLGEWQEKPVIEYRHALYLADPARLIAAVRGAGAPDNVMIVAHNPGLEKCAALLIPAPPGGVPPHDAREMPDEKFPPGALAVLDFAVADWHGVRDHGAVLTDFVRPQDLYSPDW
jgi:phosphohistidine phosphatase